MAIGDLAPRLTLFPNDGWVLGFQPTFAGVDKRADLDFRPIPQPAVRYSSVPMQLEARVLISTTSNGRSSWPMRLSSASTSAAVTTCPSGRLRKSSLTPQGMIGRSCGPYQRRTWFPWRTCAGDSSGAPLHRRGRLSDREGQKHECSISRVRVRWRALHGIYSIPRSIWRWLDRDRSLTRPHAWIGRGIHYAVRRRSICLRGWPGLATRRAPWARRAPMVRVKNPWWESYTAATVSAPHERNRDKIPSDQDRTCARPTGICVYSGMVTIGNSVKPMPAPLSGWPADAFSAFWEVG